MDGLRLLLPYLIARYAQAEDLKKKKKLIWAASILTETRCSSSG